MKYERRIGSVKKKIINLAYLQTKHGNEKKHGRSNRRERAPVSQTPGEGFRGKSLQVKQWS